MSHNRSSNPTKSIVQIVGPDDQWILEKLARKLAAKLPYAEFVPWKPQPTNSTKIAYYVNYALYEAPSGLIDIGYFSWPVVLPLTQGQVESESNSRPVRVAGQPLLPLTQGQVESTPVFNRGKIEPVPVL